MLPRMLRACRRDLHAVQESGRWLQAARPRNHALQLAGTGGFESKPLVSIVPHGAASADVEALADLLLGVCLVDCSTGRFNVGTVALHQIDVLLRTHRCSTRDSLSLPLPQSQSLLP